MHKREREIIKLVMVENLRGREDVEKNEGGRNRGRI